MDPSKNGDSQRTIRELGMEDPGIRHGGDIY